MPDQRESGAGSGDPHAEPATTGSSTTHASANGAADVVDFDALNAALAPPPVAPPQPVVTDSEGRPNAAYVSAKPHTLPKAHVLEEADVPAVIVAEQVSPSVPEIVSHTVPLGPAGTHAMHHRPGVLPSPTVPFPPAPAVAAPTPGDGEALTMPLPRRAQRRPRQMTVVVRERRPSSVQRFAVFAGLLVVFVAGGIAALLYQPIRSFDFAKRSGSPTGTPSVTPSFPPPPMLPSSATVTASATAPVDTTAPSSSSAASASTTANGVPTASSSSWGVLRKPSAPPRPQR